MALPRSTLTFPYAYPAGGRSPGFGAGASTFARFAGPCSASPPSAVSSSSGSGRLSGSMLFGLSRSALILSSTYCVTWTRISRPGNSAGSQLRPTCRPKLVDESPRTHHERLWEQRGEVDDEPSEAAPDVGELDPLALANAAPFALDRRRVKEGRVVRRPVHRERRGRAARARSACACRSSDERAGTHYSSEWMLSGFACARCR